MYLLNLEQINLLKSINNDTPPNNINLKQKIGENTHITIGDNAIINANNYDIKYKNIQDQIKIDNDKWNIKQDTANNFILQTNMQDILFIDTQGNMRVNGKICSRDMCI